MCSACAQWMTDIVVLNGYILVQTFAAKDQITQNWRVLSGLCFNIYFNVNIFYVTKNACFPLLTIASVKEPNLHLWLWFSQDSSVYLLAPVDNDDSFYVLPLVIKSIFINVTSVSTQMRAKAYPWTDVYHRGQRARCVCTTGFRTDMFRFGNAAVGNDFNQIYFFLFLILSPLLHRRS